ncbi:MAG: lysophospholipid acyltransferase family protein [Pseudomonadota bacterium]
MNIQLIVRPIRIVFHLLAGLLTCALLFPWLTARRRDDRVQRWSVQLLGICGVSVEQGPGAPALEHAMIVANHVSWLDIFAINSLHPCRFVAKAEIRAWPLLGWLVAQAGTVFIARGKRRDLRHIFKGLVASLERGERVAFFPEGTTAAQGGLLDFHANLFEAAIDARVAVQPYALRYVDAAGALHPAAEYIGETSIAESLRAILSGPPMRAVLTCLPALDARGAHRRELAQAAHDAIAAALGQ